MRNLGSPSEKHCVGTIASDSESLLFESFAFIQTRETYSNRPGYTNVCIFIGAVHVYIYVTVREISASLALAFYLFRLKRERTCEQCDYVDSAKRIMFLKHFAASQHADMKLFSSFHECFNQFRAARFNFFLPRRQ